MCSTLAARIERPLIGLERGNSLFHTNRTPERENVLYV
jgi:hypothetical protein